MCTKIPSNALEERLRWVLPIVNKEVSLIDATKLFPGSQRTLERWVASYQQGAETALLPKSTRPKTQPNEMPIRIKERIIELRREAKICAKKLNYKLKKEGIVVGDRVIGKIIKTEKLVRKYRIRKLQYKYIKVPLANGALVEIDVKYVPDLIGEKQYYQFTAIDCASRWRHLAIYEDFGNGSTIDFLNQLIAVLHLELEPLKLTMVVISLIVMSVIKNLPIL